MSKFVRAVSLSTSGLVVVFGGFLILASAFYACPYGQSNRSGPGTLFRRVTSFVLRLRPRRMSSTSITFTSSRSIGATRCRNASVRQAYKRAFTIRSPFTCRRHTRRSVTVKDPFR